MKSDAKSLLKKILVTYDDRLAEEERKDVAKREADAAFPVRFTKLRTETIRPALQEFVEELKGHGHEAIAREQEESSSTTGGVSFAAISLRVHPKPFAHKSPDGSGSRTFIEVTFSANRHERKVTVSSTNTVVNSNGSMGKRGEYELDALTAEVVAEHVLRTLQEAL